MTIFSLLALLATAQTTALVGGTIVDGTGAGGIANGVVVVAGDRIACVGTAEHCPVPADAVRMDVTGRWLTPGLVDAHVHYSQTGWIDGRPDGISAPDLYPYAATSRALRAHPARWHRSYLCSGITAVYDVGGHPWTTGLAAATERDPQAPHVRAAGPLVTHATRAALRVDDEHYTFLPMDSDAEANASVARLVAMGAQAVKVWYLAPQAARRGELDARVMAIGAAARAAGLPLIVHATGLREAKVALRAGATMLVHSVEDQAVDQEFLDLLLANQATYAPTLTVGGNWTRALASIALNVVYQPDDPNGCVDRETMAKLMNLAPLQPLLPERLRNPEVHFRNLENAGAERAVMAANLRQVQAAGGRVVAATDAGNPLTLHGPSIYGEVEAMERAGLPAATVLVLATRNGAEAMGRLADFGTLEVGKIADLLVLAEDPQRSTRAFRSLTHVMRAGQLHTQESLRAR
ncbi:MAG: amidohydrolase family protein [Gemmatimonadales bacterium]